MDTHNGATKFLMTVMAFFMTLGILAMVFGGAVFMSVLNRDVVIDQLEDSGYYERLNQWLSENTIQLTQKAQLPESVADGLYDTTVVANHTKEYSVSAVRGLTMAFEPETTSAQLRMQIYAWMEGENMSKGLIDTPAFNTYLAAVDDLYRESIQLSFFRNYTEFRNTYSKTCGWIVAIGCIVACLSGIMMCLSKHPSYMIRSFLASAWVTAIGGGAGLFVSLRNSLQIAPAYFAPTGQALLNQFFYSLLIATGFLLVLAGLLGAVLNILKKK